MRRTLIGSKDSPFVNCEVEKHLCDHDTVEKDVEYDADEDGAIAKLQKPVSTCLVFDGLHAYVTVAGEDMVRSSVWSSPRRSC